MGLSLSMGLSLLRADFLAKTNEGFRFFDMGFFSPIFAGH